MNSAIRAVISTVLASTLLTTALIGQSGAPIPLPSQEPEGDEFRFAAIGDSGTGGREQYKLAERLLKVQARTKFNLLLFLGDNIYESGSPKGVENKFIKPYAPLFFRGVEFRGVIGNHDALNENGVVLQQLIFGMGVKTFYSFSKEDDLVEFFALDSTLLTSDKDHALSQVQLGWLESALSGSKSRWRISFMHHPMYSSAKKHGVGSSRQDEMNRLRGMLEPLFVRYDVALSISGHDHVYERTKPQQGVQYFTSGVGAKLRKGDLGKTSPFYDYGNDQVRSFLLFSVAPESIRFWCIDVNGNVLDSGLVGSGSYAVGDLRKQ